MEPLFFGLNVKELQKVLFLFSKRPFKMDSEWNSSRKGQGEGQK